MATLNDKLPEALVSLAILTKPVGSFTNEVNSVLASLLDSVASVSTKTRRPKKSTHWFTDET